MKRLVPFLFLFACKSPEQKNAEHVDSVIAEGKAKLEEYKINRTADSIAKKMVKSAWFDTVGCETGPIKIISSALVKKEYSNYKDIRIVYRNVSGRAITGIKFKWYGEDAFGEPADMGTELERGFGGGISDDLLRAGKTTAATWGISSGSGKKIVKAWVYQVAFDDGTKWESGRH